MRQRGPRAHGPVERLGRPHRRHTLGVRSFLLLVVLVPTLGMAGLAVVSVSSGMERRDVALRAQNESDTLASIVEARVGLAGEETQSAVVSIASDLGVDVVELSEIFGIDYRAAMLDARAVVDNDATLETLPTLAVDLARLTELRSALDSGTATFAEVGAVFDDLIGGIDDVWRGHHRSLQAELAAGEIAGSVHDGAAMVRASFDALSWGSRRVSVTIQMLQGTPDATALARLLVASSRQGAAIEELDGEHGPAMTAARQQRGADPAAQRFERTLNVLERGFLEGTPSALASDPTAFGEAFVDGAPWAVGLGEMARGAATDLRNEGLLQEQAATRGLVEQAGLAVLLTLLALGGALFLGRSIVRPVRRLEAAAHQVHQGRFDLEPIATDGPSELADTATAFNEMAVTLATVEAHAVALADDPDAPILSHELPGRTGRALQVALNRLRASIRGAELQRRELEEAATRDGMTGLLNRTAALVMIERDLARALRGGDEVMALFVDLDGLKTINDEHGHAAGDDALVLTADALRSTTRQSDVVARLGGDEFLVAGLILEDRDEVEILAERIRTELASRRLVGPTGPIPLHCSIGMALSGPGVQTVDQLIQRADAALYLAKGRGRDQVAWDDQSDGSGVSPRGRG